MTYSIDSLTTSADPRFAQYRVTVPYPSNDDSSLNPEADFTLTNTAHYMLPVSEVARLHRTSVVKKDRRFNRKNVWGEQNVEDWRVSLIRGNNITPFYLIHVESSYNRAVDSQDEHNIKYWGDLLADGYTYITAVGGNRLVATGELYEEELIDDTHFPIHVIVRYNATIEDAHAIYGAEASGVPPNDQEKRNGIWGEAAQLVREISDNWRKKVFCHFTPASFNTIRMIDDELVASCLHFFSVSIPRKMYTIAKVDSEVLDKMYADSTDLNLTEIKKGCRWVEDYFKSYYNLQTKGKIASTKKNLNTKGYLYGVLALYYVLRQKGDTQIRDMEALVSWYHTWISDKRRSEELVFKGQGRQLTFNNLLAGTNQAQQVKKLLSIIEKQALAQLRKLGIVVDKRKSFTSNQIQQAIEILAKPDSDGLMKVPVRINGQTEEKGFFRNDSEEFAYVTVTELDTESYVYDHVVPRSPQSKNVVPGTTDIDNLEFVAKDFNDWKDDTTPLYSAPIEKVGDKYQLRLDN